MPNTAAASHPPRCSHWEHLHRILDLFRLERQCQCHVALQVASTRAGLSFFVVVVLGSKNVVLLRQFPLCGE